MKLNYGRTFVLGFGFFGVSVIWGVYNAFVPIFLQERFGLAPAVIAFFMTLDNIAALFIQPAVGAWYWSMLDGVQTAIFRPRKFWAANQTVALNARRTGRLKVYLPLGRGSPTGWWSKTASLRTRFMRSALAFMRCQGSAT